MNSVTKNDSGTVSSDTSARIGEIQNIIPSTPSTVMMRGDRLGHGLLHRRGDVVDVVGDPAQQVPARVGVEVLQRQPAEFDVDVLAQPVHRPLGDPGHQVLLTPREHRADEVHDDDQRDDLPERDEVDPVGQGHRREHLGLLHLPGLTQAFDRLLLADPGRQLPAHDAGEDHVGRLAEQPRPEHGEEDADHREHEHHRDDEPLGVQPAHQPFERGLEVARLLRRQAQAHAAHGATAAGPGPAAGSHHRHDSAPLDRARRCPDRARRCP